MDALGVTWFCTNQTRVGMGPRMVAAAERYRISPAFHTHNLVNDPNEIASPASLDRVLAMSKLFMVNLDIGHYARGGQRPVRDIKAHHDRITHLHIRDQKRDGTAANIGDGDLRVAEILRTIRDNRVADSLHPRAGSNRLRVVHHRNEGEPRLHAARSGVVARPDPPVRFLATTAVRHL